MPDSPASAVTAYELLGAHPSAPIELVSACYWLRVSQIRGRVDLAEPERDVVLHRLGLAYQDLSEPERRASYDARIRYSAEPLTRRHLPQRRSLLGKKRTSLVDSGVDPYEVMGLARTATTDYLPDAYRIMRDRYLRTSVDPERRPVLLALLDESLAILSDESTRAAYSVPPAEPEAPPTLPLDHGLAGDPPEAKLDDDGLTTVAEQPVDDTEEREIVSQAEAAHPDDAEPEAEGMVSGDVEPAAEGLLDEEAAPPTAMNEVVEVEPPPIIEDAPAADAARATDREKVRKVPAEKAPAERGESAVSHIAASGTALVLGGAKAAQRLVGALASKETNGDHTTSSAAASPPPAKKTDAEIEEVFLGRLASSVRESEKAVAHGDGSESEPPQS